MAGLHRLGTHSVENVGKIADGSLDLLYIPGEVAPEWLCRALPYWLPKLRDGATICGEVYGLPHWPDATYTLAFLLGTPERVDGDGRWWKTYRAAECKLPLVVMGDGRRGVVFVNSGAGCLESLILSLFAARKHWAGWIVVMHYGAENESLRLLCARLGVELCHVCIEARADWDELLEEVARCAPCPVAMVLLPWHLAVGALASAFDGGGSDGGVASTGWQVFRSEPRIVDEAHSEEGTHRPPQGQPMERRFTFAPAQTYEGTAEEGCVVVFSDAAEEMERGGLGGAL